MRTTGTGMGMGMGMGSRLVDVVENEVGQGGHNGPPRTVRRQWFARERCILWP